MRFYNIYEDILVFQREGYGPSFCGRIRVNRYLNVVLWVFIITGPAIAAGVHSGIFHDISYKTCVAISVIVAVMAERPTLPTGWAGTR